jgi:hypothetical protein
MKMVLLGCEALGSEEVAITTCANGFHILWLWHLSIPPWPGRHFVPDYRVYDAGVLKDVPTVSSWICN